MGSQAKIPPLGFEEWSVDDQIDYVQTCETKSPLDPRQFPFHAGTRMYSFSGSPT